MQKCLSILSQILISLLVGSCELHYEKISVSNQVWDRFSLSQAKEFNAVLRTHLEI